MIALNYSVKLDTTGVKIRKHEYYTNEKEANTRLRQLLKRNKETTTIKYMDFQMIYATFIKEKK